MDWTTLADNAGLQFNSLVALTPPAQVSSSATLGVPRQSSAL